MKILSALFLTGALLPVSSVLASDPAEFTVAGPGTLRVVVPAGENQAAIEAELEIDGSAMAVMEREETYPSLPVFDAKAAGWRKGLRLESLKGQETTTPDMLIPASVTVVRAEGAAVKIYQRGKDYDFDDRWGTIGRLEGGGIGENEAVVINYRHRWLRLDNVVLDQEGGIHLVPGEAAPAAPLPPALGEGQRLLGRLWWNGKDQPLHDDQLFPLLETAYPEPAKTSPTPAEQHLPKTLAKLRSGEPVRILAWGDSVTDARYLPDRGRAAWQVQFVKRLEGRFPRARIELVTEAWGGRNTGSYLAEPPGSEHNYEEKVLAAKPDLIVSEFVNDAGLNPDQVKERYGRLLADFSRIGAEWIILTPHYTRPDWMGLESEKNIDDDPRPYIHGLRAFAAAHPVALAEGSLRYGRLWRQAIPYSSLMLNSINHPDERGMTLFAAALMEIFP